MKTQIIKNFFVKQNISKVWASLSDPTDVVTCVPGAAITEKIDDQNYKGKVVTKFGPIKATYNGDIQITELDESNHRMVLMGQGKDSKGKGSADMEMVGLLTEKDGGTDVSFTMDISIVGMLAQFGSRLINDVSDQLLNQFVQNFKTKLGESEPLATGSSAPSPNPAASESVADQANAVVEKIATATPTTNSVSNDADSSNNALSATSLIGTVLKSIFGSILDFFKSIFGGKK